MTGVWVTYGGKVYEVASFGEMTIWAVEEGTRRLRRLPEESLVAHRNYDQAVQYLGGKR